MGGGRGGGGGDAKGALAAPAPPSHTPKQMLSSTSPLPSQCKGFADAHGVKVRKLFLDKISVGSQNSRTEPCLKVLAC